MSPCAKHFKKRDAILACLRATKQHPSAEELYTQLKPAIPDLSIGTVYRNLTLFKKQGLAISVATVNGVERFDANVEDHVHFICTKCDAVSDLEMAIPEDLKTAAQSCGAKVHSCCLSFRGTCQSCMQSSHIA